MLCFSMYIPMIIRSVQDNDWNRIAWLASNVVQEGEHTALDTDWVKRRRSPIVTRFDSVVELDNKVVSYCALEKATDSEEFRVFIVLDWSHDDQSIAETTYRQLRNYVSSEKIAKVWMREVAGDLALLEFMKSKGFVIDKRYEYEGHELVNLSKSYET